MTDHIEDKLTMVALKGCPFCGSTEQSVEGEYYWIVECVCAANGPQGETAQQAIKLWNTRTPSTDLAAKDAEIERLRGVLKRHHDHQESLGEVVFKENGEEICLNLSTEYADSSLCEDTIACLLNRKEPA